MAASWHFRFVSVVYVGYHQALVRPLVVSWRAGCVLDEARSVRQKFNEGEATWDISSSGFLVHDTVSKASG